MEDVNVIAQKRFGEHLQSNKRLVVYQWVLTGNPWWKPWLPQTEKKKIGYLNYTPSE